MPLPRRLAYLFLAIAAIVQPATAADPAAAERREPVDAQAPVTTTHELIVEGGTLVYQATVESLPVTADDRARAQLFIVSYTAEAASAEERPVTFVFNGGPGAASAFLHLGALGPRVLVTDPDGGLPPPPARLTANPSSWLAFTDLVFMDPVGTGFSRGIAAEKDDGNPNEPFWSVGEDVRTLSDAVALWLSRNGRWASPKFFAGESYGGYRAVLMAETLLQDQGVALNGLILVSPALSFSTIQNGAHNVLPWALQLPAMVASARAQGRSGAASDDMAAVERYALDGYLTGIAGVGEPGPQPPSVLVDEVARLLGLPADVVRRYEGRVPAEVFAKRLLEDEGRVLSLYDGSITGPDPDPERLSVGADPLLDASIAPYSTAFNAYVREELGFDSDLPYRLLNRRVAGAWDWQGARGGPGRYGDAIDALETVMALTPEIGVLVVHGRYDLVTPYFASVWLIDRLDLPAAVRANAVVRTYEGGHMMYMRPDVRAQFARDAAALYREVTEG